MSPKSTDKKSEPKVPPSLRKALAAAPKAKAQWQDLTPLARRDFVSWIESAKQEETYQRRVNIACSKLTKGERRPCCYSVVPLSLYSALNTNQKAKAQWKTLTSNERRDFNDWINSAKDSKASKARVEKTCVILAAKKRIPPK